MKILTVLCLGTLGVASCSTAATSSINALPPKIKAQPAQSQPATDCLPASTVTAKLFAMAAATNQAEHANAKDPLMDESRRSPACRASVIDSIVKTMDLPLDTYEDKSRRFSVWRAGAEVLGDLKASEALDFLVAHLDFSGIAFSTTMSHQPALRAVVKIGDSAIPKLSDALRHNPDWRMRMYSVYCISSIGGPAAVRALKDALPSESDHCVRGFLQAAIEGLDNRRQVLLDNRKWFSAFTCSQ